jgi:uncharacterized protein
MKKTIFLALIIILNTVLLVGSNTSNNIIFKTSPVIPQAAIPAFQEKADEKINTDKDNDGIPDAVDILQGARIDAANKPRYRSRYYAGGYPPDNEGVCTDVIWRAFKNAGFDLKALVDKDIKENPEAYAGLTEGPDPNIDFRRVANLFVFFNIHAESLTTKLPPNDNTILDQWQPGDIVTFNDHIAIISDKRGADGIPYIVHNAGPYTKEADELLKWKKRAGITGHFRYPKPE